MKVEDIKFRASGNGHLMTEAQGKSPMEKWLEAKANHEKYSNEYDAMANKATKTAAKKLDQIHKLNHLLPILEAQKDDVNLSETCKTHLVDVYVSEKYKRREEHANKYTEKGNACEEDSITAISVVTGKKYIKNTTRLSNEWIQGEPDLFLGKDIATATAITDAKSSWSAFTYFRTKVKELNPLYYWQGQSYMWLTGATTHTVAYCLVNNTDTAIMDEKYKLARQMGLIDIEAARINNDEFIKKCKQIEINHIFDLGLFMKHYPYFDFDNDVNEWEYDIPLKERVHLITFDRNDEDIERLKARIEAGRKYIHETFIK